MSYGPSKNYRGVGNLNKQAVQFSMYDAQRIAAAVSKSETDRRQRNGSVLPRAVSGGGMQLALFTGAWTVGQEKSVKIQADTNATASVVNVFHPNIGFVASERTCMISSGTLILVRC